jgi:hypothetical protein
MEKSKSNGQVEHAVPAAVAAAPPPAKPSPPVDPFDQIKLCVKQYGLQEYKRGFRRAMNVIAPAIGQLDASAKEKIVRLLNQLEDEMHGAEMAVG